MATPTRNIVRSTAVVGACTGLSRVLGLVRLMLMASLFGTSLAQSAFVIAFKIPNLFRRLFGEGALSAAFIPVFAETIEREGREKADVMASSAMTMLGTALGAIVLGGILIITVVVKAADLSGYMAVVLPLLRIMLPYMFFICLVALCMAILNTLHHFAVPALTPVVLNVVWILALLFLCPRFGDTPGERIYGVAWGILAAGAIQLAIQAPILLKFGFRPRLSFAWGDKKVRRILTLMAPAAFGMGVFQVNTLISTLMAATVGEWAPAAVQFAELVVYLPLGIFATALGTVLLPTFSEQAAKSKNDDITATLRHAVRLMMFVMIPAAIGLAVLSRPIVQLLFERNSFDMRSTELTARALMFYAPGLIVFSLYKMLVPVFYALKDTRTPVRVGLWMVGLNIVLNVVFIKTWPHEYEHAGLLFATVLSSGVNCVVLGWLLRGRIPSPGWGMLLGNGLKILVMSLVMGAAAFFGYRALVGWTAGWPVLACRIISVFGSIGIALCVYAVLSLLFCRKELREVLSARQTSHKKSMAQPEL